MGTPIQQLLDLSGQVALVTGGSRGLGLQIAESLGEAGAKLMLTARKAHELEAAVAHLSQRGIDARWIAADASRPDEVQRVCAETLERLGRVDILVNNAGAAWGAPAEEHSLEAWDKVMNLNIRSIFLMSQQIGKRSMIPRKHGRIINIASFAGLAGAPNIMTYGVAKAGVVTLSEQLRAELTHKGIAVSVVCPSFFKTNLLENWAEGGQRMKAFAQRLMDTAKESADDIAAAIIAQSERGKFLVLPTRAERLRWRLKRFLPEVYFRQVLKMARERGKAGH